ncbi:MAG: hypothetical protein JWM81_578 [Candidatus Saccharibacteria bacterium]|nr:hypothetical protein [Candidatus Saccharibacteria bacterium]
MFHYSVRYLKRFAILLPGLFIAVLSVRDIFPYFDTKLPLALAILVTYILAAYILIPFIIRLVRAFVPTNHLPLYCVTPDGFASDPLNIGIIATRRQLINTMESIGWSTADPHSPSNLVHQILSTLLGWSYPNAPMSSLYLFGRKQDIAFEVPIEGTSAGSRHHVRFWATTYTNQNKLSVRTIHWHHRSAHVQGDNLLWVGAASLDSGIGPIKHNLQITHMIHPDTNAERDLITKQLKAAGLAKKVSTLTLQKPYQLNNRVLRGYLRADGKMSIIHLPDSQQKPRP